MHILIDNIVWDAPKIALPKQVLVLDAKISYPLTEEDEEKISDFLTNHFGFCHKGFTTIAFEIFKPGRSYNGAVLTWR